MQKDHPVRPELVTTFAMQIDRISVYTVNVYLVQSSKLAQHGTPHEWKIIGCGHFAAKNWKFY